MGDQQQARQASSIAGTKEGSSTAQHGEVTLFACQCCLIIIISCHYPLDSAPLIYLQQT
jgi:hypothetical protein